MSKNLIRKRVLLFLFAPVLLLSSELLRLQYSGVEGLKVDGKRVLIERVVDPVCLNIAIDHETLWAQSYAKETTPPQCKGSFIATVGQIQPIILDSKIETFGELEVMHFINTMRNEKSMLLIDTREESFYNNKTIPSAINIPFDVIVKSELFPDGYHDALQTIGVKKTLHTYEFQNAKTILLFCNGPWCSQSPRVIKKLIQIGYPKEKIKWYRGGMHDWLSLSMTATKP